MKLQIGAGRTRLEGYEPWDIAQGRQAFPVDLPESTAEAIHASHVLEHFGHGQTLAVIREWCRVLKPGAWLQIAVPDFNAIVKAYQVPGGSALPIEGYIMGGQTDAHDRHGAIFTDGKLKQLMEQAGLVDIRPWNATIPDCSALAISLNLEGRKPEPPPARPSEVRSFSPDPGGRPPPGPEIGMQVKVVAVCSTPRLGFMDTFDSILTTLPPMGIDLVRGTGVFWGQALTRAMEEAIATHHADWLLGIDYDAVWTAAELRAMVALLNAHAGEVDALVPHMWNRQNNSPLWTPLPNADGSFPTVTREQLTAGDLFPIGTGHFGMTFIRATALQRMPHPWFLPVPNAEGRWTQDKTDDDIYFWRKFRAHGGRAFLAPGVTVGHLELDVRWPGGNLQLLHQHLNDYRKDGKPVAVFGGRNDRPVPSADIQAKDT